MPEKPEELEAAEVTTEFVAGSGKDKEPQKETKDSEAKKDEETPSEEAEPAIDHAVKDEKQEEEQVAEEEEKKEQTEAKKRECALEDEEKKDEAPEQEEKEEKKPETKHSVEEEPAAEIETSVVSTFALEQENEKLRAELESLRQFKLSIEREQKDALIAKYHMLSDEDKADVVAHKDEYTLEQIDEKLALIYVRKNVDFSTVDGHQEEEVDMDSILSFSLDDGKDAEVVSDIQAAFRSM